MGCRRAVPAPTDDLGSCRWAPGHYAGLRAPSTGTVTMATAYPDDPWTSPSGSDGSPMSVTSHDSLTRIICRQLAPKIADLAANQGLTCAAIEESIEAGAQVVVLPELVTSGYVFSSIAEARSV